MSTLIFDPAEREARGKTLQSECTARLDHPTSTLLQQSWRDFIFAEVWSRPGLDRRSRFLVAIASAASSNGPASALNDYIRGALTGGVLTLAELREAALHLAVYAGWLRGEELDTAVTRIATELDFDETELPAICEKPWDPAERVARGIASFDDVMGFPGPPPMTPYFEAGIDSFVFGEMWLRPGLDQRSRRWITLVGVSESCAVTPIRTHFYAALSSGNCTPEELQEFVLQYAIYAGWPKASVIQAAVIAMIKNHGAGLPWDA